MGRPVKPVELKKRQGTYRSDRDRSSGAIIPAAEGVPPAPKGLRRIGKRAWQMYWSLGNNWLSPTTDVMLLARLCRAYDEEQELRELLKDAPRVIRGPMGEQTNPLIQQLRKIEELITRYEGLCGFTPSDRSRLGLAEVQRVSKLDEFLRKRAEG